MQIQIIVVGRMKGGFSYLQPGLDDYLKRLKAYAAVSIVEVPDEAILPSRTDDQVMEGEARRIRPYLSKAAYSIALSERVDTLTSEKFSTAFFERLGANPSNGGIPGHDSRPIIFIVGGPLGLHPTILSECDWTVSLSKMTFPHPMVRLILLEQLYRAFKIRRGEPYHK
ncbi:23S rRNA (pseudouridine(1915)-N(3))-methyltransferase RlmH [Vampirovibrio sp.]|uniref:23S rRNA (pseudouridine(1915)-N(3))-methyltransferase RlmH n=1 Tax=Vampirovibrio sp. TaxID=2717857 RepID=UPI0035931E65